MEKRAGIRFEPEKFIAVTIDDENNITLTSEIDGVTTEYDVTGGGGGYEEVLLWENPNPGSGFDSDLIICEDLTFDFYKIVYRTINNESVYVSFIISKDDLEENSTLIGSKNEGGDYFGRAIVVEEGKIIAKGLCSQIGADNTKKFRCLPNKVYGVTM